MLIRVGFLVKRLLSIIRVNLERERMRVVVLCRKFGEKFGISSPIIGRISDQSPRYTISCKEIEREYLVHENFSTK